MSAFWRAFLTDVELAPLPRWAGPAASGAPTTGEHRACDGELGARCRGLSFAADVPLRAVLLAAHATVLSLLTGRADVLTGYLPNAPASAADGAPLPYHLDTSRRSWRDLISAAADVEVSVLRHRGHPIARLATELGFPLPPFDTILDTGVPACPRLVDGTAMSVGLDSRDDAVRLTLRYRTGEIDAARAARIAGYYLSALRTMTSDPDADPRARTLLSEEEIRFQLESLAGPRRDLPDLRVHDLLGEQARRRPNHLAAEHGDRRLTFGELDRRATRLARALVTRGVAREEVVAVAMERDLTWMTSVVGVFRAGAVYLPVEPRLPADRVSAMLAQSGCRVALAEDGGSPSLREAAAAAGTTVLDAEALLAEGHDGPLTVEVGAHRLAYIFFTSGSTGRPKGAMVEHAGMLNHMLAKIEDLGIGPGVAVAQTAPQGFDISLWQLLAGPLAGGRTVIVDQAALVDVERLVDTLVTRRVGVLQLVPSHLEVLISHLERRPRPLPALRCISATGEALSVAVAARWFACRPDVPLVNAYGLTETSDDTNHEILRGAPGDGRVPVGTPLRNVDVSIIDENLSLVPLGTPGEIVFSGVCVGRGYVNDERLTRLAFGPDPFRPGRRMYRSGDIGRWLPDGRLEFLGRRDTQVKVRGFRIEIGEVEHWLGRMEGVRDSAAVLGRDGELVAFWTGPADLSPDALRAHLGATLPEYMIPSRFQRLAALPRTANGKTDRAMLAAMAEETRPGQARSAPETPAEQRLAVAWANVLRIPPDRVGRGDRFAELGGTSLSAVRLAIELDGWLSLEDMATDPTLADLAQLIGARDRSREGS